ncbi:MAG: SDR family oxidoreductase, partial [Escherichia coli]|nr:SDR family oxidoreductase [Escherichia coli]
MNSVSEKVVVITGASSGLGEATARLLAERGAKVVLAARRADRLNNLVSVIQDAGGEALAVVTDVTKRDDMENLLRSAEEKFGRVDVLVNNAGIMPMAAMSRLKVNEWDLMIDVNIKGVLYGIAAALPGMLKNKSGHIINLSSVAGLRVSAGVGTVYSATKFAVKAISEGLRAEVGASG